MEKETNYQKITRPYQKRFLDSLRGFVAVNSVYDESTTDGENPFGIGVTNALHYIAALAEKDGYEVHVYDNKVVEILYGSGKNNLTIMAHADVVPAGSGWDQDPFTVTEKDGVLYGRGVADDKGPLLATYYAMTALRDNGLLGGYRIRFLVGGNEETGSLCMEHYFHVLRKEQPTLGFSPDSDFPLIFAEKGIENFLVETDFESDVLFSLHGGVAFNAVIDECRAHMKKDPSFLAVLDAHEVKYSVSETDSGMMVTFLGKAAHGSVPEEGINAGMIALREIGNHYGLKEMQKIVACYTDVYGRGVNAYDESPDMGKNSLNVGVMDYEDGHFRMVVNFRHVNTTDTRTLIGRVQEASKPLQVTCSGVGELLYYPKDSLLVSTLLHAYQAETGDTTGPLSTGGGTYAKEADNVVAFGMQFRGWDSKMHSPGEGTRKTDFFRAMAIYARAIVELGEKLK